VLEHRTRQTNHVAAGGEVVGAAVGRRQAVDAVKLAVRHPQRAGLLVHQGHEAVGAPGHVFGDGIGGIVGGFDQRRLHQFIQGKNLASLQEYLGSAHAFGLLETTTASAGRSPPFAIFSSTTSASMSFGQACLGPAQMHVLPLQDLPAAVIGHGIGLIGRPGLSRVNRRGLELGLRVGLLNGFLRSQNLTGLDAAHSQKTQHQCNHPLLHSASSIIPPCIQRQSKHLR